MSVEAFGDLFAARASSRLGHALRVEGVRATAELRRIAELPRRPVGTTIDVAGLSSMLRAPGGTMDLMADQARALQEMHDHRGAFVGTAVGSGKSLMILLGARVVDAKRPLVLMPASARSNFAAQIEIMRKHWRIADNFMTSSYESLSTTGNRDFLATRLPDWIFADEAHFLKTESSARTARFLRFFDEHPETRLCAFSGSFIDRSVHSFAHILRLCLRGGSPLPNPRDEHGNKDHRELDSWAKALDAGIEDDQRFGRGALQVFVDRLTPDERAACDGDSLKETQRAFGKLLAETPGVVFSSENPTNVAIHIRELPVEVPKEITEAFELLRGKWETLAGEKIRDAVHLYRIAHQLAQGFYLRWVWPNGQPNKEWLDARRAWHSFARKTIVYGRRFDSYKEVKDACERWDQLVLARQTGMKDVVVKLAGLPVVDSPEWRDWLHIRGQYTPVTETVWVSDYVVDLTADWLAADTGVAWVESIEMGQAIRRKGFRYYGGGENEIIHETVSCAAAVKAHYQAKNLQQFKRFLVVTPPTSGAVWEQLIGRIDRKGQKSATVSVELPLHVREMWRAFYRATQDATFATAPGVSQKLLRASTQLITDDAAFVLKTFGTDPLWRYNDAA